MAFFTPVFHFGGQCADAMAFYAQALGGKIKCQMTYAEADPADYAVKPGSEKQIYHAEMEMFGQRFMMADDLDVPYAPSSAMFLNVFLDTEEEVRAAFDALSVGAERVLYAPRATAYSACHSSLVDRFGVRWTLMTEQTGR